MSASKPTKFNVIEADELIVPASGMKNQIQYFYYYASGAVSVGVLERWLMPTNGKFYLIDGYAGNGPEGGKMVIDVAVGGRYLWDGQEENRPSIADQGNQLESIIYPDNPYFNYGETLTLTVAETGEDYTGDGLRIVFSVLFNTELAPE